MQTLLLFWKLTRPKEFHSDQVYLGLRIWKIRHTFYFLWLLTAFIYSPENDKRLWKPQGPGSGNTPSGCWTLHRHLFIDVFMLKLPTHDLEYTKLFAASSQFPWLILPISPSPTKCNSFLKPYLYLIPHYIPGLLTWLIVCALNSFSALQMPESFAQFIKLMILCTAAFIHMFESLFTFTSSQMCFRGQSVSDGLSLRSFLFSSTSCK